MANTLLLKKSGQADETPSAGELSHGELAINYADGKLFFKNSGDSVVEFLSSPGTGAGQVLFSNGSTMQGDSTFFYDDTNNRLGIGTTAPSANLEVYAADGDRTTLFKVQSGNGVDFRSGTSDNFRVNINSRGASRQTGIVFKNDGTTEGSLWNEGGTISIGSGDFATPRLSVKSDGNVGIGLTAPDDNLTVVDSIRIRNSSTIDSYYSSLSQNILEMHRGDSSGAHLILQTINDGGGWGNGSEPQAGGIEFKPDGTSAMYIGGGSTNGVSHGNVGIGTLAPNSLLTIMNSAAAGAGVNIAGISTGGFNNGTGYIDLVEWGTTTPTAFGAADTYGARLQYDGTPNEFKIRMGDTTSVVDALTIARDTGNATFAGTIASGAITSTAGISGTTGTFSGTVDVAQYIKHTGDTDTYINFTDNNVQIAAEGATVFNMTPSGTTLYQSLTITNNSDNIKFSHDGTDAVFNTTDGAFKFKTTEGGGSANISTYIDVYGSGTGQSILRLFDQDDAEYGQFEAVNGTLKISTEGSSPSHLLLQPTTGNVGIGTTGPTGRLTVSSQRAAVFAGSGTNAGSYYQDPTYPVVLITTDGSNANSSAAYLDNSIFTIGRGGNISGPTEELLRVNLNGNVGIGTDSPQTPLEVQGHFRIDPDSGSAMIDMYTGGTRRHEIVADTSGNLEIRPQGSGTTRTKWDSSGNLDFGGNVTVQKAGAETLFKVIGGEANNAEIDIWADEGDDNADKWRMVGDTSGNLTFSTKSTGSYVDALQFDSSANVWLNGSATLHTGPISATTATFAGDITLSQASHPVLTLKDLRTAAVAGDIMGDIDFFTTDDNVNAVGARIRAETMSTWQGGVGLRFYTHGGSGTAGLTEALSLSTANLATFAGDVDVEGYFTTRSSDAYNNIIFEAYHAGVGTNSLALRKSNHASSVIQTVDEQISGMIHFQGVDTNNTFVDSASIIAKQNGSSASGRAPTQLSLSASSATAFHSDQLLLHQGGGVEVHKGDLTIQGSGFGIGIGTGSPASSHGFSPGLELRGEPFIRFEESGGSTGYEFVMNSGVDKLRLISTTNGADVFNITPTAATFAGTIASGNQTISSAQAWVGITSTTGTNVVGQDLGNGGNTLRIGVERNIAGGMMTGVSGYSAIVTGLYDYPLCLGTNETVRLTIANGTGNATFTGDVLPAVDNSKDLGDASYRWANLYVADMQMNNVGTGGNDVDGTEGSWTIQEGEDDLFLLNRKNGKKYKFKLEVV